MLAKEGNELDRCDAGLLASLFALLALDFKLAAAAASALAAAAEINVGLLELLVVVELPILLFALLDVGELMVDVDVAVSIAA